MICYLAEHIEDEELRTSFLSRPEVQSLLAKGDGPQGALR